MKIAVVGNAIFLNNYNRYNRIEGCKVTEAGEIDYPVLRKDLTTVVGIVRITAGSVPLQNH